MSQRKPQVGVLPDARASRDPVCRDVLVSDRQAAESCSVGGVQRAGGRLAALRTQQKSLKCFESLEAFV
jgi:hypothetical protein